MYYGYSRKTRNIITVAAIALTVCVTVLAISGSAPISSGEAVPAVAKDVTVIIDAGHGGEDPGAVGIGGVLEKTLNLDIATEISRQLLSSGIRTVLTRDDDRLLLGPGENVKGLKKISDLKNRCELANGYESAIFISIHMNSYGSERCHGLQAYYGIADGGRELATCIQSKVRAELQTDNKRATKSGKDLYLLENCKHPSVIVECGFITNIEECKKLSQKEYQKELSFSIVCGIIEYINKR